MISGFRLVLGVFSDSLDLSLALEGCVIRGQYVEQLYSRVPPEKLLEVAILQGVIGLDSVGDAEAEISFFMSGEGQTG